MSQIVVTARIDAEVSAKLDRMSAFHARSRSWLIAQAVKRYADEGVAYLDFVQEGLDSIERGETVAHEEIVAEFAPQLARRKSAA